MKRFADLFARLDETNKTGDKVDHLVAYLAAAPPADVAWAIHFLMGRRIKRLVKSRDLASWAAEAAGIPQWLWDECHENTGDMAEAITLLLPEKSGPAEGTLTAWIETNILPLAGMDPAGQAARVRHAWTELDTRQRFVFDKLITGELRLGVSKSLVLRALEKVTRVPSPVLAHRLMGPWEPGPSFLAELTGAHGKVTDITQPYPYFLAHPLAGAPAEESLGPAARWQAEWKWDGIRAQLIRRQGTTLIWSRGEELVTDRYPELGAMAERLRDGTVLDGELLPWKDGQVLPFALLQRRLGRKTTSRRLLAEVPVVFMAYDVLELEGNDVRHRPLVERRAVLEGLVRDTGHAHLILSPVVPFADWDELARRRAESRERGVEGFMIKRLDAPYRVGRPRGDWWKWKVDPHHVDAVLVYAQKGSGRRAGLFTDYTFGIRDANGALVPFAKAYSGLTDEEIAEVDRFVRTHTVESFGPVRAVEPELVFEIAFEDIRESTRHRSGIAVRFPRIARWRRDKKPDEIDSIDTLRALMAA